MRVRSVLVLVVGTLVISSGSSRARPIRSKPTITDGTKTVSYTLDFGQGARLRVKRTFVGNKLWSVHRNGRLPGGVDYKSFYHTNTRGGAAISTYPDGSRRVDSRNRGYRSTGFHLANGRMALFMDNRHSTGDIGKIHTFSSRRTGVGSIDRVGKHRVRIFKEKTQISRLWRWAKPVGELAKRDFAAFTKKAQLTIRKANGVFEVKGDKVKAWSVTPGASR